MENETRSMTQDDCIKFLSNHCIGHLAYIAGKSPFIVPVTYYYDKENKCLISYSGEGHKVESMRRYSEVALQVEEVTAIHNWRSVMVNGTFEELKGATAKKYLHTFANGVQDFLKRVEGAKVDYIKDFSSKMESETAPVVYCIHISDIIGKYRVTDEEVDVIPLHGADTFG
ncbi:pyridoxamine 5'-phosphate oxidase family protein [Zobellia alginiliquefaciens]|uniref:pyridoxamine 5'-phosphate oxidase family protein n=1 Tax=Zobellia alginiliquefaciens TaxID=3032586 RepID=UPI0023E457E0|nr:pyridoxamine 5'-phosphate oxidase family protein [Zobellia alginiliquefaciens]